jgi:serine/threonine protein kinase
LRDRPSSDVPIDEGWEITGATTTTVAPKSHPRSARGTEPAADVSSQDSKKKSGADSAALAKADPAKTIDERVPAKSRPQAKFFTATTVTEPSQAKAIGKIPNIPMPSPASAVPDEFVSTTVWPPKKEEAADKKDAATTLAERLQRAATEGESWDAPVPDEDGLATAIRPPKVAKSEPAADSPEEDGLATAIRPPKVAKSEPAAEDVQSAADVQPAAEGVQSAAEGASADSTPQIEEESRVRRADTTPENVEPQSVEAIPPAPEPGTEKAIEPGADQFADTSIEPPALVQNASEASVADDEIDPGATLIDAPPGVASPRITLPGVAPSGAVRRAVSPKLETLASTLANIPRHSGRPSTSIEPCTRCDGILPFCPMDALLHAGPFTVAERFLISSDGVVRGDIFIFDAEDQQTGKPVQVRLLRPGLMSWDPRFLSAADLAGLRHGALASVYEVGQDATTGIEYVTCEAVSGTLLSELIDQEEPVATNLALRLLDQLSQALQALESEGYSVGEIDLSEIRFRGEGAEAELVLNPLGLARPKTRKTLVGTAQLGTLGSQSAARLMSFETISRHLLAGTTVVNDAGASAIVEGLAERLPSELRDHAFGYQGTDVSERRRKHQTLETSLPPVAMAESESESESESGAESESESLLGLEIGGYKLDELLGTGGAGDVYRATHTIIGSRVAIKVLQPRYANERDMVERFVQEARTVSDFGSAGVPRCFDFGYLKDGRPYAVMEFLDGENLADHLARVGQLSINKVADILMQVSDVLGKAHEVGIVHRDIKPDNLFLINDDVGTVKVLDFGVAKLLATPAEDDSTLLIGTPTYCAPEQWLGQETGPAADIFALGSTAFELLSGQRPFTGDAAQVMAQKTRPEPPDISEHIMVPRAVQESIAKMMARSPEDRPESMAGVGDLVESWTVTASEKASVMAARTSRSRLGRCLCALARRHSFFECAGRQEGTCSKWRSASS